MTVDERYMRAAVNLARRGWGRTSPNPLVGAIVVKNDAVVGRGWHQQAGGPHAEVHALDAAGETAHGATLYVTLEPCSSHGRTPPCTERIAAAGIKRVVAGTMDPNPKHRGRGIEWLQKRGIATAVNVEHTRCEQLNAAFFCWIRTGKPYVTLKLAMTADGRIATRNGHSQWITGLPARRRVQRMRQWADAILVGADTVRRDNPQLLVREPQNWPCQPLRLVASRSGDIGDATLFNDGRGPARLICCESPAAWQKQLAELGSSGITSILVEGGGELAADMLAAGVIDNVAFFIAPKILGGRESRPAIGGDNPLDINAAMNLNDTRIARCGDDFLLTGYITDVHRLD